MAIKKVLVTGGAGFIGSRLSTRLADQGHEVLIYDNLHPQIHGNSPRNSTLKDKVDLVIGDIRDYSFLQKTFRQFKPTTVFHMAAETGTSQSMYEIDRYVSTNIQGTVNLLGCINGTNTVESVILPSSRAIYGEGCYFSADGTAAIPIPRLAKNMAAGRFEVRDRLGNTVFPGPTPESSPPNPASIYGSTKLMQEYLLTQGRQNRNWKATIFRLQNVYGDGQSLNNPYTGVLSIFCSQLACATPLNIYEDGKITRDFVYVSDVVDALALSIATETPHGEVFNIGSGKPVTILDAAKILIRLHGREECSYFVSGDFRDGDVRYACADIGKAEKVLGWRPETGFEEGLRNLSDWARQLPSTVAAGAGESNGNTKKQSP